MNWRTNSRRHESPGLTSSPKTLTPSAAIPPAFSSQLRGGTSGRQSERTAAPDAGTRRPTLALVLPKPNAQLSLEGGDAI